MNLNLGDTQDLIDECYKQNLSKEQTAYVLATAYWETARTMKPISEYRGTTARYAPYYGRGYVQLTWKYNYEKASKICGVDFVKYPEKVKEKRYALKIAVTGMKEGWFTNKKLSDFIHGSTCDYYNARTIINGHDQADRIAGYAREYESLIKPKPKTFNPFIAIFNFLKKLFGG